MALLRVDSELIPILESFAGRPAPQYKDAVSFRNGNDAMLVKVYGAIPYPEGMTTSTHAIPSLDGTEISVWCFLPRLAASRGSGPQRAAIWAFGGGMISGSVEVYKHVVADLAETSDTQIFAVDYRRAPEHPFPKAVEDMYAAVAWLQANAGSFNVDPARVVVAGQSAGGGLAAATALMARDKGLAPPIAGQMLKYPMLDDRTTLDEDSPLRKQLSWSVEYNEMAWATYLGGKGRSERNDTNVSPYAAPARAKDLAGLPRTFIDAGGLDLFKGEALAYAARLVAANVDVEFHLYPGVPHGYDGMAFDIGVTRRASENIGRFLSSF